MTTGNGLFTFTLLGVVVKKLPGTNTSAFSQLIATLAP
jgi:hypothetical protein